MDGCKLCRGSGLFEVRLRFGATTPLFVNVEGKNRFCKRIGTTFVRCTCAAGNRFEKGFALFDRASHEPIVPERLPTPELV